MKVRRRATRCAKGVHHVFGALERAKAKVNVIKRTQGLAFFRECVQAMAKCPDGRLFQHCEMHGELCHVMGQEGNEDTERLRMVTTSFLCFDWSSFGTRDQAMGCGSTLLLSQFVDDRKK